jgi:hypothetical protein
MVQRGPIAQGEQGEGEVWINFNGEAHSVMLTEDGNGDTVSAQI